MRKTIIISLVISTFLLLSACAPAPMRAPEAQEFSRLEGPPMEQPAQVVEAEAIAGDVRFAAQPAGEFIERIVIKNASLDIIVARPDQTLDAIARMAEEMGGFVVSANLYQSRLPSGVEIPRGTITIRVPAERLDEALSRIEAHSDRPVENKTINSQDVTTEYTDLQSRLRNLEAAETQLINLMDRATKIEDVLNVFNQLTQVREQIEVIKGQIQYYEQSARLSSITANLIPKEAVEPLTIGGWQPVGVARNAVQALINALQILVNVAIWIVTFVVPLLVVIFLPLFLVLRVLIRWWRRRKARHAQQAPTTAAGP